METYRRQRRGKIEIVRKKVKLDPTTQGILGLGVGLAGIGAVGAIILAQKRRAMYAEGTDSILNNLGKQMERDAANASRKAAEVKDSFKNTAVNTQPSRADRDRLIDYVVERITGRRPQRGSKP